MKPHAGSGDWALRVREFAEGDFGIYDVTNSAYRFYVLSNGKVGLNTVNPAYNLTLNGATAQTIGMAAASLNVGAVGGCCKQVLGLCPPATRT